MEAQTIQELPPEAIQAHPRPRPLDTLSPFLSWEAEPVEAPPVEEADAELLFQLLRDPVAVVERALDPEQVQRVAQTAILVAIASGSLAAGLILSAWGEPWREVVLSALMVPVGLLGALVASLFPIYGLSVLYQVRMPLSLLITLLSAATAGAAQLLLALSCVPFLLWQLDRDWAGPLSLVAVAVLSALACGSRLRALFAHLIGRSTEAGALKQGIPLWVHTDDVPIRVAVFVRLSMFLLIFTNALASWAWMAR